MAKSSTKVGKGLPGFGDSRGSTQRIWEGGEFLIQLDEVTAQDRTNDQGDDIGVSVRFKGTFLDGPTQNDDVAPKGKNVNLFLNVNYDLPFTVDQLKDAFIAANVKTVGDDPPYHKLAGKKVAGRLYKQGGKNDGVPRQGFRFISPSKSKLASEEDDD